MRSTISKWVFALLAVLIAPWLTLPSSARVDISGRDAQGLASAKLIYIATVRKDGNQSNAASVWFTMSAGNKAILIQTGPQTWKAKRIKRDGLNGPWTGELAHKVERLGYSALWIPEGAGRDPFAHAGYLLSQTEKLIVASGIASVWSRSCSSEASGLYEKTGYPARLTD